MKEKSKKQMINHFIIDQDGKISFHLIDPNLPEWNYPISAESGAGQVIKEQSDKDQGGSNGS